ncbi:general odorant-binding protein 72 [Tribolium castaneum]|uniref:Odorant binding protein 23 n=1 Tax=Tribolium castaneum TaxID=7070 RepID=D6X1W0_TRICA|nr:PREDICTED: general odorant-binding protein 72 [Tribolium castaneum]EFA10803.1 odorant binding protein 23 [Tribolium castaneum]|eukprot:XP_008197784.2 PREDICTED: general odorant-binding protein 72 [Tribolium castaneum]
MKYFPHLCLCLIFFELSEAAMSEAQLKAAVKLVRNMCQPKSKATNEDIEKMHHGDWNIDRTAMCYMHCALNSNKLITKENVFNRDYAITLAEKNLPTALKTASIEAANLCKDSAKTLDDKCVAAYEISKCLYESNPEKYFLP